MCILPILLETTLGAVATSFRRRIPKAMQREIDHLKKELCRERRRRSLTVSDFSSNDEEDGKHRQRSRTPLSESFSHVNEYHHKHKGRNSPPRAWGMML